jgi:hypothetical protein
MDADLFDRMSRLIGTELNRRGVGRGLAALGVLWGLGLGPRAEIDEASAKKKRKHKSKKRRRKRKSKKRKKSQSAQTSGPEFKADAACSGETEGGFSAGGNSRFAQTFTALGSGPLERAEVLIREFEGTAGDYILRLSAVNAAGVPTNTVLATAIVPDGDVPVGTSLVSFTFPTPFSVVAGVRYALVITRPGANTLEVNGYKNDTCAGGAFYSNNQTGAFSEFDLSDLTFTTSISA